VYQYREGLAAKFIALRAKDITRCNKGRHATGMSVVHVNSKKHPNIQ